MKLHSRSACPTSALTVYDDKCYVVVFGRRLSWFDGTGMGFSLEYPTIGLHAISRDLGTYPQEHLYVMVNAKLNGE